MTVWPDGFPRRCRRPRAVRPGTSSGERLRGSCVHSAARHFDGFGLTPATRSAALQKIGIDLEQAHSGQVLAGLHVVDPPDHQVARGLVDVEQLRACGHFADTVDHLAVDAGDLRARQALLEQGCNRRILQRWLGRSALACLRPDQRCAAAPGVTAASAQPIWRRCSCSGFIDFSSPADEHAFEEDDFDIDPGRHLDHGLILLGPLDQVFGDHVGQVATPSPSPPSRISPAPSFQALAVHETLVPRSSANWCWPRTRARTRRRARRETPVRQARLRGSPPGRGPRSCRRGR